MVKLNNLNEPALLYNLKLRYDRDEIYTYVATILVSVNPFKMLPVYTPEILDQYIEKGAREMPPHAWAIADNAYKALMDEFHSQSVVISGGAFIICLVNYADLHMKMGCCEFKAYCQL